MNTLADEFLADLGEDFKEEAVVEGEKMEEAEPSEIGSKLLESDRVQKLLQVNKVIDFTLQRVQSAMDGQLDDSENQNTLMMEVNDVINELSGEISKVSQVLREKYGAQFPELESLVLNPVDYAKVVQRVGNRWEVGRVELNDLLPAATVMVLQVTHTTTAGSPLSPAALEECEKLAEVILQVESARQQLYKFLESRMSYLCPNLQALVGSTVAARLVGAAGGIAALARIPSNLIGGMGASHGAHTMGVGNVLPGANPNARHEGFIADAEVVTKCPPMFRKKMLRVLAGRVTLAARVDSFREDPSGSAGQDLRAGIEQKADKWQEPPPIRLPKPLPAPDDRPKKRRGGKRMRAIKQKYEMTEMRKQANRINFGVEAQETVGNTSKTLGMLGVGGSGKVRLSAANKGILKKKTLPGTSGITSGLSSSLAFTPVQGLELKVGSEAPKKEGNKYFGQSSFAKPLS